MDMNPLDKIKEGVKKQDWGLVCEGYNAITGHNLSLQTDKPDTDDDEENAEFNEVVQTGKGVGLYGNTTVLITEKPTAKQIKANKERAARGNQKVSRPPPRTYKVKCTDCEKTFESRVKAGEFGQKCSSCLRATRRDR